MVGFVALGGDGSLDGNGSLENKDFNVGMVGFVALGDDGSLENNDSNVGMVGVFIVVVVVVVVEDSCGCIGDGLYKAMYKEFQTK